VTGLAYAAQQQKTEAGMANFTKPVEGFNTGGPKINPGNHGDY
jgi:hypothetical protein